jgi:hypothetical protein
MKEITKIVNDGDIAISNLIDIDSETDSILKRFPLMNIVEKKESMQRYKYLKESKLTWLSQINLVKDFFQNTINDLSSLEEGWFEKQTEARKVKKLNKMLKNEFKVDTESMITTTPIGGITKSLSLVGSEEAIPLMLYTDAPEKTKEEKALLKQEIEEIQEQKKSAFKFKK